MAAGTWPVFPVYREAARGLLGADLSARRAELADPDAAL